MRSFTTRLLTAASVVLIAFLGLTGLVLDRAFRDSALVAVQDRLQAQIYILLGAANVDAQRSLALPKALAEARYSNPGSGLYALVVDKDDQRIWRSDSLLGMKLEPLPPAPATGVTQFAEMTTAAQQALFIFGFTVSWQIKANEYQRYTFWVAETREGFAAQVNQFRRSLWTWLLAVTVVLLAVQGFILRWSLLPLRRIARQVREIETGQREALTGTYPVELQPLADNLNNLVERSRDHLERYRNALADLAHSLKTPLAVLRSSVDNPPPQQEMLATVQSQVKRMNETVDYQLQRAAAAGHIALTSPVTIAPIVHKITDSLHKVYRDKALQFDLQLDQNARFYGDEGDLMEILGNLTDNACKWAQRRVRITLSQQHKAALSLHIEDDGPGIAADKIALIVDRGGRADPTTPGHGIGLAVVKDIVENVYSGHISISSSKLGGVDVHVQLSSPY